MFNVMEYRYRRWWKKEKRRADAAEAKLATRSWDEWWALIQQRDEALAKIEAALALYPENWEWNGGQGGGRLPSVGDIHRALRGKI